MKRCLAGAILVAGTVAVLTGPTAGQVPSTAPGQSTTPAIGTVTAPKSRVKPQITLTIGATSLRVPLIEGHCPSDQTQDYDREFIGGFTRQTQSILQYLNTTFECKALAIARGGTLPTSEFANYMALNGGTPADLQRNSRQAAAEQVCSRQQLPGQVVTLQAQGQVQRVAEFSGLPNGVEKLGNAVIGTTSGVCYTGRFLKSTDGPFQETIWAQGWTRVRGHIVTVIVTSGAPKGRATPYNQLYARLSAHMAELIAANPD